MPASRPVYLRPLTLCFPTQSLSRPLPPRVDAAGFYLSVSCVSVCYGCFVSFSSFRPVSGSDPPNAAALSYTLPPRLIPFHVLSRTLSHRHRPLILSLYYYYNYYACLASHHFNVIGSFASIPCSLARHLAFIGSCWSPCLCVLCKSLCDRQGSMSCLLLGTAFFVVGANHCLLHLLAPMRMSCSFERVVPRAAVSEYPIILNRVARLMDGMI